MKRLLILPTLLFFGCQHVDNPSATQNDILNSVSSSSAKKERAGILQESIDNLEKKKNSSDKVQDTIKVSHTESSHDEKIVKKGYLQNFIDSISFSSSKDQTDSSKDQTDSSKVKELDSMPVIGK